MVLAFGALLDGIPESAAPGITMLADTMMPEAFERGGARTGLLTALGFVLSFLLSRF